MAVVDCFTFFNELDILELRLKTLWDVVDIFVLVESPKTHKGNDKPLYFKENRERFKPYMDKIRHIVSPVLDNKAGIWDQEKYQRDHILSGIRTISDDSIVMISDVDEIPNPMIVPHLTTGGTFALHMFMFEYSFDYMFDGEPWIGTVITNCRECKIRGPNFFRDNRWNFTLIKGAGWHCSSFGDVDHVWNKIQNYAHADDDKHKGQTREDFEKFLKTGVHSDGTTRLKKRPEWVPLPAVEHHLLPRKDQ